MPLVWVSAQKIWWISSKMREKSQFEFFEKSLRLWISVKLTKEKLGGQDIWLHVWYSKKSAIMSPPPWKIGLPQFKAGGADSAPPVLFQQKRPEWLQKVDVIGYKKLSYYVGKTPEKVLGHKRLLDQLKILEPWNLDFLTFARISVLVSRIHPEITYHHNDIGFNFYLP